jgi:predicted amidohydrolase
VHIAAAQITAGPDPASNLECVWEVATRAVAQGAELVVLPEATMACFGSDLAAVAQPLDGPWANGVRALATKLGAVLVVGMFEPAGDGRVFNTVIASGPGVEAAYRKIHLYDAFGSRESDLVAPGSESVLFEVAGVRTGVATCFDLRFPAQFQDLARSGAELVVVPASWGDGPGKAEQWDLLTRARAADAVSWLVAADQAWVAPRGTDPLGIGRSVVVDPLGQVRGRLGAEPGILLADVDPTTTSDIRRRVPIL